MVDTLRPSLADHPHRHPNPLPEGEGIKIRSPAPLERFRKGLFKGVLEQDLLSNLYWRGYAQDSMGVYSAMQGRRCLRRRGRSYRQG